MTQPPHCTLSPAEHYTNGPCPGCRDGLLLELEFYRKELKDHEPYHFALVQARNRVQELVQASLDNKELMRLKIETLEKEIERTACTLQKPEV